MSTSTDIAFRLNHKYDRDRASDGHSRYGAYLRDRQTTFEEIAQDCYDSNPSVPFAAAAWRIANGPIMVPPFVVSPRRVQSARLERNDWDGEGLINVELIANRPEVWRNASTAAGNYYRDWPVDSWGDYGGVGGQDLVTGAYLLTTAQVLFRVPPGTLPHIAKVPTRGAALYAQAIECLEAVLAVLNREIAPLLA